MNHNFRIPRASEYIALLEERLSKRTLAHVLSVAEYMVSLSELLEIPYERAVTAVSYTHLTLPTIYSV